MTTVSALWRHPIKSHGREALDKVTLIEGQTMPWDRHWAVTHDRNKFDGGWVSCGNFMRGSRIAGVAGLWANLDTDTGTLNLRHARLGSYAFNPDDAEQQAGFFAWLAPIYDTARDTPAAIVSAGDRGMTDSAFPSLSIMSTASHAAVSARLGGALEPERWRGNIWLDGLAPWEEFEWIGKRIVIGDATLEVAERIERCTHTMANPKTGERDADTLAVLNDTFGHQDFGVYAWVVKGGDVALGDTVKVL